MLTHKKKVEERECDAGQPDEVTETECKEQVSILSLQTDQGKWREDDVNDGREADQNERGLFAVKKYGDHCERKKEPAEKQEVLNEDLDPFQNLLQLRIASNGQEEVVFVPFVYVRADRVHTLLHLLHLG